jgi:hypothetical protein
MNKILLALLTSAAVLVAGAGTAQAATGTDYYFTPGSTMKIVDHEPFGANEVKTVNLSNVYLGRITGKTTKTLKFSRCAGGEVRYEISIDLTREDDAVNRFDADAFLDEGASCSSSDLDGYVFGPMRQAFYTRPAVGDTGTVTLKASNTEEGGDYATTSFQLYGTPVY